MKKQKKQLLIWGILLVVIVAGLVITRMYNNNQATKQAQAEEEEQARLQILTLAESSITSITYTYEGETIALSKNDETWQLESDPEATVSETMVSNMTAKLMSFYASERLTDLSDIDQFGLVDGYETITVTTDSGETHTIYVGDWNSISSMYYVMSADADGVVYMITSDYITPFQKSIESLTDM